MLEILFILSTIIKVQKIIVDIIDKATINIGASSPFNIFPKIIRNKNIINVAMPIDFRTNLINNNPPHLFKYFANYTI